MRSAAIGGVCRRRGAALVEIIISLLLIGVAVSAIMSAMLSTSVQSTQSKGRERTALCLNQLLQELRNYVTAETSSSPDAPGGAGASGWKLPKDTCSGLGANCWALAVGSHNLDLTQARAVCGQNLDAMKYDVTAGPNGTFQVAATVTWTPE